MKAITSCQPSEVNTLSFENHTSTPLEDEATADLSPADLASQVDEFAASNGTSTGELEQAILAEEATSSGFFAAVMSSRAWVLVLGVLTAYAEFMFGLLTGDNVVDAIWPHAVRSLSWTMTFRAAPSTLFAVLLGLAGVVSWVRRRHLERMENSGVRVLLSYATGVCLGLISLHFLMDLFYLKGAFLLLPASMGWILACLLVARDGLPRWRTSMDNTASPTRMAHLLGVFLAAWLVMPGVPALAGLAPSPPDAPLFGYGGPAGPFNTVEWSTPYELPAEVVDVQGDLESDVEFSVHITLPIIPSDLGVETVPLAILLHGFFYPDQSAYSTWIEHLAGKGMAVAFLQYPSDLRPAGFEDHEPAERNGQSDFLQHHYRDLAIREAMNRMSEVLIGPQRHEAINDVLGNITVDPNVLWAGGHSLGAAYTFLTLDEAMERGWGQTAVVVALEAPADRPMQDHLQPNLSGLPELTLVQIGIAEDDTSVGGCPGAHHQLMFNNVASEQNQLIEYRSDKYGFPRLVASHYLQTDPAHDRLSDWGFYRRVDAQADFLVAQSRNDTFTSDWALSYMLEPVTLTGMGRWSDGTPVLPLSLYDSGLNNHSRFEECRGG